MLEPSFPYEASDRQATSKDQSYGDKRHSQLTGNGERTYSINDAVHFRGISLVITWQPKAPHSRKLP